MWPNPLYLVAQSPQKLIFFKAVPTLLPVIFYSLGKQNAYLKTFVMEKAKEKKIIITPASAIDFKSEKIKTSFEKIMEKKKAISTLSKIDRSKLSICISV